VGYPVAITTARVGLKPRALVRGGWEPLFDHAMRLIDSVHSVPQPFWTFGGGTALMLRYRHRESRAIDIFLADPQYLGFVTPRLSDVAESVTNNYIELANHIKLIRPEGEIDFVVAANLTEHPFEEWELKGKIVRVETGVEIIAKKMWYRGDIATARDLFDLTLMIDKERRGLRSAAQFLVRHRDAFLTQLRSRERVLKAQFEQIATLDYKPSYDECTRKTRSFLRSL
jgi:hypothetical protein